MKNGTEKKDNKMISIEIKLWTDGLAATAGAVRPKHAWSGGMVYVPSNALHGIKASKTKPFNSMADLAVVIEDAIIAHGIKLHPGTKMKLYMAEDGV